MLSKNWTLDMTEVRGSPLSVGGWATGLMATQLLITKTAAAREQFAPMVIYRSSPSTYGDYSKVFGGTSLTANSGPVLAGAHHILLDDPLSSFTAYNNPNWDGFDAEPITSETVAVARRLASLIPAAYGEADIAPGADGTIGFEWHPETGPIRKLYIDIGPGTRWSAYWQRRGGASNRVPEQHVDAKFEATIKSFFEGLSA
jgi:hypothetical protein